MIAVETLIDQVRSAAPFLFAGDAPPPPTTLLAAAEAPRGWLQIIRHANYVAADLAPEAYFVLCLACHHASVGTFVPTDVDSKIRGHLWAPREDADAEWLSRQAAIALRARRWDIEGIAARFVRVGTDARPVSGHDGEHLSVLGGALASLVRADETQAAGEFEAAIDDELAREARAFQAVADTPGAELDLLRLAALLAHNQGDVDQALSFWPKHARLAAMRERFTDLAHQPQRYGGAFAQAARLYAALLAPEGHRNYPLRAVKALRRAPDLLLPLGPFLDDWGRTVARHKGLDEAERAEVAAALLAGCRKLEAQDGYYRALAGMNEALPRGLDALARLMPSAARATLKDPALRRKLAVPQASFESSYRKRARSLVRAS